MIEVSTSVLDLSEEDCVHSFYNLETAKTDYFHIDVMDGAFVENDTSKRMLEYATTISHISQLGLDVHLMVNEPEKFIDDYACLEPRILSFQVEPVLGDRQRIYDMIDDLKRNGIRVGLAINPGTSIEEIKEFLPYVHMVLVMSVWAGLGGQEFFPETVDKIKELKQYLEENDLDLDIEVDGGITDKTAKLAAEAGANILVSGSFILGADDPKSAINSLKNCL
ncbi:MAG: ribulose-phosphate 3-epimerase [Clostridia bacterium]|nr:ribulose-phosphate 3-epimerase [Clostridia bacterium]